jgi:2-keto-4-pentenoate hydratase/2-oxohepta-3-ene-1,7-dioic acid hydratase in catechol pathway
LRFPVKLVPSTKVDYECELAIVIGRKACKNVSKAEALDYVLGYTCANDVSARDWQRRRRRRPVVPGQELRHLLPARPGARDPRRDPQSQRPSASRPCSTASVMQDWNTNDMIFDVPAIIAFLSASKTLLPGTVILTGTPHGVGFARKPARLAQGRRHVSIDIEKIGTLTNPVINEPV